MSLLQNEYLQKAYRTFNNGSNWWHWRKVDDDGNKIPNDQRMSYEHTLVRDGAVLPSREDVEGAILQARIDYEVRLRRNVLLSETDFYALQDVNMTQEMTNYRQALRDLPAEISSHEDIDNLVYPTKP